MIFFMKLHIKMWFVGLNGEIEKRNQVLEFINNHFYCYKKKLISK